MSTDNKEFYELLNSIANEQTFSLDLCPREAGEAPTVSCKQLSTAQLKKLIETVVDSPLTQSSFNSTVTNVFKQSLIGNSNPPLNVIDRLLFVLETRIQSLSPSMTVKEDGNSYVLDFKEISNNLKQKLKENFTLLLPSSATEGKLTVTFGLALLEAEAKLNEEIYRNTDPDVENAEELRNVLGEAFIHEIAKAVRTISIEDRTLDLSTVSFKSRLKAIETIPASLIQRVIEYVEKHKEIVDQCLAVDGHSITIDGSIFSLR